MSNISREEENMVLGGLDYTKGFHSSSGRKQPSSFVPTHIFVHNHLIEILEKERVHAVMSFDSMSKK